jgi:hypothetical protein
VDLKSVLRAALAATALTLAWGGPARADFRITINSNGPRPVSVRDAPKGYLLASIPNGTTMTVQRTSGHWFLGRVGGPIDRCGWVERRHRTPRAHVRRARRRCESARPREFSNGTKNSRPPKDGAVARLYTGVGCSAVHGYVNAFPWRRVSSPTGELPGVEEGMGVRWRYVSHDGRFVVVRAPGRDWFFVPIGCVAAGRNPGCFKAIPCPAVSRRAVSRSAAARFQTDQAVRPFAFVGRSRNGAQVEVRAEASCAGANPGEEGLSFKGLKLDAHGHFHGQATAPGWSIEGRFDGDRALGTFRIQKPDCDTGVVQFDAPRLSSKVR